MNLGNTPNIFIVFLNVGGVLLNFACVAVQVMLTVFSAIFIWPLLTYNLIHNHSGPEPYSEENRFWYAWRPVRVDGHFMDEGWPKYRWLTYVVVVRYCPIGYDYRSIENVDLESEDE